MSEPINDMRDVWRIYYPHYKKDKEGYPILEGGMFVIDEEWIKNNPQPFLKCLSCGVRDSQKNFKHLPECKATIQKGYEFMTEEQARNYQYFGLIGSKPYKKGGWRELK